MINVPVSELNSSPSIAVFEPLDPNSVRTRLTESEIMQMPTNGHTLESLRDLSSIARMDSIDRLGAATGMLADSAAKYSKSGLSQMYYKQTQNLKK